MVTSQPSKLQIKDTYMEVLNRSLKVIKVSVKFHLSLVQVVILLFLHHLYYGIELVGQLIHPLKHRIRYRIINSPLLKKFQILLSTHGNFVHKPVM